jgi:hypothetical protein
VQCTEIDFAMLIANDILRSCCWLLKANWQQRAVTWDRYRSQYFDVTEDDNIFRYYTLGRFGQQIRNTRKVLKCDAGEGWRRSVRPIM